MIFGSVCSGIEAASVAWYPLGWRAAWLAEIEPSPSLVLAHHYPDVPNLGDMTKIAEMIKVRSIPAPDVLVGGTPCQAFSVAGARKGLSDDRGFLTIKFVELADAIDENRTADGNDPSVIVWENVPGVLSSKDNAFGAFLGLLAGEDCELQPPGRKWSNAGYVRGPKRTIAWRILDAQYFGVAQRRRRVFVVASARKGFDPAAVLFESEGVRRDIAPSREAREETAGTLASRTGAGGFPVTDEACSGYVQPVKQRWPAEVACTLDAAFGSKWGLEDQHVNAGCPLYVPVHAIHGTQDPIVANDMAHCLGRNSGQENAVAYSVALRGREGGATAELGDDLAGCLRASSGGGDKPHALAPVAYGIPGNWIGRAPENGGNATEPMHDVAPCQTVADRHGVAYGMQVRRLTPIECERLQGFPDGYTLVPVGKKQSADGPRYKALGNSMAVPCMAWIGKRIQDHAAKPK